MKYFISFLMVISTRLMAIETRGDLWAARQGRAARRDSIAHEAHLNRIMTSELRAHLQDDKQTSFCASILIVFTTDEWMQEKYGAFTAGNKMKVESELLQSFPNAPLRGYATKYYLWKVSSAERQLIESALGNTIIIWAGSGAQSNLAKNQLEQYLTDKKNPITP
jgi:hypothetical protein